MTETLNYIQLIAWIATVVGLYFKMKHDISMAATKAATDNEAVITLIDTVKEEIEEIKEDRKEKWKGCDDYRDKASDRLDKQCKKLNEINMGVAGLGKDVKWIVKQLDNKK